MTSFSQYYLQVTRMILLDVIVVGLSNIPLGMFLIYAVTKAMNRLFTPTESLLIILAQLISTFQVFGSFYLYLMVSSVFRNNVKKLLYNIICFWKPRKMHLVAPSVLTAGTHPTANAPSKMPKVDV